MTAKILFYLVIIHFITRSKQLEIDLSPVPVQKNIWLHFPPSVVKNWQWNDLCCEATTHSQPEDLWGRQRDSLPKSTDEVKTNMFNLCYGVFIHACRSPSRRYNPPARLPNTVQVSEGLILNTAAKVPWCGSDDAKNGRKKKKAWKQEVQYWLELIVLHSSIWPTNIDLPSRWQ